jgi:2-iminobutanoate/2-iminopropanoate deaminase
VKRSVGRHPSVPLSAAVIANGFVFVSGQVPRDAAGATPAGIEAQTRLVLENVRSALEQAGATMDQVVKTTVFLTRVEDFAAMNRVYSEFFQVNPPARSTIRADLVLDALVEIEAVAALAD